MKTKPLSKTKRRAILLKLAAHIEKHPPLYRFMGCGEHLRLKDPMCPLQRIAKWSRLRNVGGASDVSRAAVLLGFAGGTSADAEFYKAADIVLADMQGLPRKDEGRPWLLNERGSLLTKPDAGSTPQQIAMALRYMAWSP
jgi:hypothetical protein